MSFTLPNLGTITGWLLGTNYKADMETNLKRFDRLIQLAVINTTTTAPPGSPAAGDRYLIAAGATGAWTGKDNQIATYVGGVWEYETPNAGWMTADTATNNILQFDGANWVIITKKAVTGFAVVNMGGGNYTMTYDEAIKPAKAVINSGAGSTLTWPSSADVDAPTNQYVWTGFNSDDITIASQTGGGTSVVPARSGSDVIFAPGTGVLSAAPFYAVASKKIHAGLNKISGNYTLTVGDAGKPIILTGASSLPTLTIDGSLAWNDDTEIPVGNADATYQLQFAGTGGATLYGRSAIDPASGGTVTSATIRKDGSSNDWYIT